MSLELPRDRGIACSRCVDLSPDKILSLDPDLEDIFTFKPVLGDKIFSLEKDRSRNSCWNILVFGSLLGFLKTFS